MKAKDFTTISNNHIKLNTMVKSFIQKKKVAVITLHTETKKEIIRAIAISVLLGGVNGHRKNIKNLDVVCNYIAQIENNSTFNNILFDIEQQIML